MARDADIPSEFLRQYDQERAGRLRRRAIWYCIIILSLVFFSWGVTALDLAVEGAFEGPPDITWADILTDTLFTLIFGAALGYFIRTRPSRAEIVRTFQWVLAVAGLTAVAVTPLVLNADLVPGATLDRTPESDFSQAIAVLMTVFVLHFTASVLVALSAREGLMPLIPVFLAYAAWVLFVSSGSAAQHWSLIGGFVLTGLPGFAWSLWRYRSFNERFNARTFRARYAEVTRELAEARRVHEALFPPPVTRGSVRVAYRYEPARHIGGDFLFVHPLAVAPAETSPPLSIVIIDVTGHGVTAALAVSRLNSELERTFSSTPGASPGEVLGALNRFTHLALAGQCIFATALCLRVDPGRGMVEWASAGHPPAFLRRATDVRTLDATAPMLGVLDDELFEPDQKSHPFQASDAIVAYTDGVVEAMGPAGLEFGIEAARRLVREQDGSLADALMRAVESHRAGPPDDDTLVVEIRPA